MLKSADYEAVYGARQRRSSPQFAVFFRSQTVFAARRASGVSFDEGLGAAVATTSAPGSARPSRFGISVKKALGNAVVRNRIRRRIREILRRNRTEIPSGWDIVIHPRKSVAEAPFASLELELVRLLCGLSAKTTPSAATERAK